MNVLSLFDGISCGKLALERAGFTNFTYYASEIDKNAIKCSQDNHSDIIRLGDVTKVSYSNGVLHSENGDFKVGKIDLLIGGSPCQSFSAMAAWSGNNNDLDGKSKLFYEYLRILKDIQSENPSVKFLLENVRMRKDSKQQLDKYLGTMGVEFNSSLVSYQVRTRFYWTNWFWQLPNDRHISFQDYKESDGDFKLLNAELKTYRKMWSGGQGKNNQDGCANVTNARKVYCLQTKQSRCPNSGLVAHGDFCRYLTQNELEQAQTLPKGYTKSLTYNQACAVIGNGWTVDAVAHIFSYLNVEQKMELSA